MFYHITNINALIQILEQNRLGINEVSVTRNPNHVFCTMKGAEVILNLNKEKIKNHYKIFLYYGDVVNQKYMNHTRESEERIPIPVDDINLYINEIVLLQSFKNNFHYKWLKNLVIILDYVNNFRIPLMCADFKNDKTWIFNKLRF